MEHADPPPAIIAREAPVVGRRLKSAALGAAIALLAAAAFLVIGVFSVRGTVTEATPDITKKLKEARTALASFNLSEARASIEAIDENLRVIRSEADRYQLLTLVNLWGAAAPKVKAIPDLFRSFEAMTAAALGVTENLEILKEDGFAWLMAGQGKNLVSSLDALQGFTAELLDHTRQVKQAGTRFGYPLDDDFAAATLPLSRGERFLKSLTSWLKRKGEKRFLVIFQNESEMRPGGGFIGSYGELIFDGPDLKKIAVNDIYPPDRELEKTTKIVPPKELQGITALWGARDANWFFDFRASAEKVMQFLESSPRYEKGGVRFDGVLAINVSVVESILDATGPISLSEYGISITSENFLPTVQREVEAGKDKFVRREPKRILTVLAPKLFERVAGLGGEEEKMLLEELRRHLEKKNIMLYSKNVEMQTFFEGTGVAGAVFEAPPGEIYDYLAVVNTNVAGGKSDAYVSQRIRLSSKIDALGAVNHYLAIERSHQGEGREDRWYRSQNHNYLKVFTPLGSELAYAVGHDRETVRPAVDYRRSDFQIDPELAAIEATRRPSGVPFVLKYEESGKTVFGSWFTVEAGETETFELQYEHPSRLPLGRNGVHYTFVFDRQSGAATDLDILLETPPGYHFLETGNPVFNYFDPDPPRRVRIDLTLARDPVEARR